MTMHNDIVVKDSSPQTSYSFHVDAIAATSYTVQSKKVNRQSVIDAAGNFFKASLAEIKYARKAAKRGLKHL